MQFEIPMPPLWLMISLGSMGYILMGSIVGGIVRYNKARYKRKTNPSYTSAEAKKWANDAAVVNGIVWPVVLFIAWPVQMFSKVSFKFCERKFGEL